MATENIITETDELRIRKAIEQAREMQRRSAENNGHSGFPNRAVKAAPPEEPDKRKEAAPPQNRPRGLFGLPFTQPEQPRRAETPERPVSPPQTESRGPQQSAAGFRHLPSPQEIFMKTSAERPPPYCGDSCPVKKILGPGDPGGLKGMDSDMLMLFALMLLLSSEGADQMMLFALLYILL